MVVVLVHGMTIIMSTAYRFSSKSKARRYAAKNEKMMMSGLRQYCFVRRFRKKNFKLRDQWDDGLAASFVLTSDLFQQMVN